MTDTAPYTAPLMLVADPSRTWHVAQDAPWFPNLDTSLRKAPDLLDQLLNEYAPHAVALRSQNAFWMCFHMYVVTRLSAEALDGRLTVPLEDAVWCAYATAYWGLNEAKRSPDPAGEQTEISKMLPPRAPTAQSVEGLARQIGARLAALDSDDGCLRALPGFLADRSNNGMIHGFAYNSQYMLITGETAPLGHRPQDVQIADGSVRITRRDTMRVDYGMTSPPWLAASRAAYELVARDEAAFSQAVASIDLADLWSAGINQADLVWGRQDMNKRRRDTYIDIFTIAMPLNASFEATALNGLTAMANKDARLARGAIQANAIAIGYWETALMAIQDPEGAPPAIVAVGEMQRP